MFYTLIDVAMKKEMYESKFICPNCGTMIDEFCEIGYCEGCHSEYYGA